MRGDNQTVFSGPSPQLQLSASEGFVFADPYAIGLAFAGLVLFAAIWVLSSQNERAFSPAAVYLVLGVLAAAGLSALGIDLLDPVDDAKLIEHLRAQAAAMVSLVDRLERIAAPS